ncbi:Muscle M-line assembly protein unc-89 [Wickerhamomyces ciferrii]|uniref:Muscle M-line assembly protein unc-89 n=1 Tax=Wickerhamomyces ciferrii (strain ATCC 14091 / BCRC 22168 / CBS 111 / JCM 3599 / NBRC 0793 / NRRL Y-1031 F-60-10) TaxID=1206466 RepID=K0KIP2_WICCF|nr:Muscle M-line assembly protein unc-89 [Wickerhamomyces ciferrii]CCH42047.1 Muscle M-line assembly protein unc-89 [Wickerhamomyces ciferrii]
MSQQKDKPSSRLRSSPRERSVESQPEGDKNLESQPQLETHSQPPSSSASSIFSVRSKESRDTDNLSQGASDTGQGSPKKTGSTLKNLSKFWKSHKKHKSLDVVPQSQVQPKSQRSNFEKIRNQFESQNNPSRIIEEDENVQSGRERSESKSKSKSPIPGTSTDIRKKEDISHLETSEENVRKKTPEQETDNPKESLSPKKSQSISDSYIEEVLGISLDQWPYSEELLLSTIALKTEKEKTKKQHLKLTSIQSSIDLIKLSVATGIPPNQIPNVFVSSEQTKELINKLTQKKIELEEVPSHTENVKPHQFQFQTSQSKHSRSNSQSGISQPSTQANQSQAPQNQPSSSSTQPSSKNATTSVFKVNIPQQTQFQFHHWQKPGEGGSSNTTQQETDKKRKLSTDEGSTLHTAKPQTPNRNANVSSHRRNQSEANVSQLRTMFETQSTQQQHQQQGFGLNQGQSQTQQQAPPQWGSRALGSPYYPPRERRPVYYQFPAPPPPPNQQTSYPQQVTHHQLQPQQHPTPPGQQPQHQQVYQIPQSQGQPIPQSASQQYTFPPQVQYYQPVPPPQFVFPPKPPQPSSIQGTPQRMEPSTHQVTLQPSSTGQPYSAPSTINPLQQQNPIQYRESSSVQGSPISMKRGSTSSTGDKGKSDVNFLISTPNNPPKR